MRGKLLYLAVAIQSVSLVLVVYQFIGTVFNVDSFRPSWELHEIIEVLTIVGLITGFILSLVVLRMAASRSQRVEDQLAVAAGSFARVATQKFDDWGLTPAEREVAILIIKGFSVAEIAALREKSEGTIKAQNTSIYQKSGLQGRLQFVSYFLEEIASPL